MQVSATRAATSAPQPPVGVSSWAITRRPVRRHRLEDRVVVEGKQGERVDHLALDPLRGKLVGGGEGAVERDVGGDDGEVRRRGVSRWPCRSDRCSPRRGPRRSGRARLRPLGPCCRTAACARTRARGCRRGSRPSGCPWRGRRPTGDDLEARARGRSSSRGIGRAARPGGRADRGAHHHRHPIFPPDM